MIKTLQTDRQADRTQTPTYNTPISSAFPYGYLCWGISLNAWGNRVAENTPTPCQHEKYNYFNTL